MPDFLGDLLKEDRGVIVCCNIVDGLDEGLYDGAFVRSVLDWWENLCSHENIVSIDARIDRLRYLAFDSVFGMIPNDFRVGLPRPMFGFTVSVVSQVTSEHGRIAHVMPAHYLATKMSANDLRRFKNNHGVTFPLNRNEWTADIVERLKELSADDRTFVMQTDEPLHPCCLWYTRVDDLKSNLESTDTRQPDVARDILGLVHYGPGVPMAALYIPNDESAVSSHCRPTFMEAGNGRRFKARTAVLLSSWGYTVDLNELETAETIVDGCPERIAKTAAGSFQVGFDILGVTSGVRGEPQVDSDKLFARLLVEKPPASRTKADIESRLRSHS